MASSRKRGHREMEAAEPLKELSLLERIRNMWQFANLNQWIFIFGRAVKIDENLDIEDLEMECLKSHSTVLPEIGLALLKFVSSHRGLTHEIFDEYTRRQYVAKAPDRNPFGIEEEPKKFNDFDIFTKIRVLQQLTQWTMGNPDRIRERMEEQKDTEQAIWRIEPFGWDSEDRTYIILDDNRLYRRTDTPPPPPPAAKPKKNSKKAKAALRASKRRKVSEAVDSEADPAEESAADEFVSPDKEDDGFGGMKWECVAVTLDEINSFLALIEKSRDANEKILRKRILEDLLPLLEKQEEARKRKATQKERELLNLEKLATAKRSSRIAGRLEQQRQEDEVREAERKRQAELAMAKKEQEKWTKLEKERESRMMTREQRLKEREARRILHEEELANLSEDSKKLESGQGRLSERHLKAEIERKKQALEDLAEEEDWIFDCICGAYGQIDDGTHSIACEKCNIWQHSKCVGVSQAEADREDFHFICKTCERRAKDAERAKTHPPIKIKINRSGSSSSPMPPKPSGSPASSNPFIVNGYGNLPPSHNGQEHQPKTAPQPAQPISGNAQQSAPWKAPYVQQTVAVVIPQSKPSHQASSFSTAATNASNYDRHPNNYILTSEKHNSPYTDYRTPASNSVSRPLSAHAFSSPLPHSPTNLPPPAQHQSYSFINGNTSGHAQSQSISAQLKSGASSLAQFSPSPATSQHYEASPTSRVPNGHLSTSNNRRSSINLPSPLSGIPAMTPANEPNAHVTFASSSTSPLHLSPIGTQSAVSGTQGAQNQQIQSTGQSPHLPPVATGLSPTKHSPPTTLNGGAFSTTPSVLPSVTTLSPSPQPQNLTPPVKHSELERSRENGQSPIFP